MKDNKKPLSYFKGLSTKSNVALCAMIAAIVSILVFLADYLNIIAVFKTLDQKFLLTLSICSFAGLMLLIISFVTGLSNKNIGGADNILLVGFFGGVFALVYTCCMRTLLVYKISATVLIFVLDFLFFAIRKKKYQSEEINEEKVCGNVTFKTYYSNLFKNFGIWALVFGIITLAILVAIDKINVVSLLIKNKKLLVILCCLISCVLFLFIGALISRYKNKRMNLLDPFVLDVLVGSLSLPVIAQFVGERYRLFLYVTAGCVFLLATVISLTMALKTHILSEQERLSLDLADRGFKIYYKNVFKNKAYLLYLAVSLFLASVILTLDKVDFLTIVCGKLGLNNNYYIFLGLAIIALCVFGFFVPELKKERVFFVDALLFIIACTLITVIILDFAILKSTFGLKIIFLLSVLVVDTVITAVRVSSVRELSKEIAKSEVVNEVVKTDENENTNDLTVEEVANETVEQEKADTDEEINNVMSEGSIPEENEDTSIISDNTDLKNTEVLTETAATASVAAEVEVDEQKPLEEETKLVRVNPKKSFRVLLETSSDALKENYSEIKNLFCSYGIHSRITKTRENFSKKGTTFSKVKEGKPLRLQAILKVRGKYIKLFLNINPENIDMKYYHAVNVSDKTPDQPIMIKICSRLSLKKAKELIEILAKQEGFKLKKKFERVDYKEEITGNELKYMQRLGFDYLIKENVLLQEVKRYDSKFLSKILIIKEIDKPERYIYDEVSLDVLSKNYNNGDTVTPENLREKELVKPNANSIKIIPSEKLDKVLNVTANTIDENAAKMIFIAGGLVTVLQEKN